MKIIFYLGLAISLNFQSCKIATKKPLDSQDSKVQTIRIIDSKHNPRERFNTLKDGVRELVKMGLFYKVALVSRSGTRASGSADKVLDEETGFNGICSGRLKALDNQPLTPGLNNPRVNQLYQQWMETEGDMCHDYANTLWREFGLEPNPIVIDWFNKDACQNEWADLAYYISLEGITAATNGRSRMIAREICQGDGYEKIISTPLPPDDCLQRIHAAANRVKNSETPNLVRLYPQDVCCARQMNTREIENVFDEVLVGKTRNSSQEGVAILDKDKVPFSFDRVDQLLLGLNKVVGELGSKCSEGKPHSYTFPLSGLINNEYLYMASETTNLWENSVKTFPFFNKLLDYHKAWTKKGAKEALRCGFFCASDEGMSQDVFDFYKIHWLSPLLEHEVVGLSVKYKPVILTEYVVDDHVFSAQTEGVSINDAFVAAVIAPLESEKQKYILLKSEEVRQRISRSTAPESMAAETAYWFGEDGDTPTDNLINDAMADYLQSTAPLKLSLRLFKFAWKGRKAFLNPFNKDSLDSAAQLNGEDGSFVFLDNAPVVEYKYDRAPNSETPLLPIEVGSEQVISVPRPGIVSTLTWKP